MKWLERSGILSIYLFLFLPMVALIALSFNSAPKSGVWQSFTWDWYLKLFENKSLLTALENSVIIATGATFLSLIFGISLAFSLCRSQKWTRRCITAFLPLPILLPDVILGIALLSLFVWLGFPLGLLSVMLAHSTFGAAYMATVVRTRLLSLDPYIEDAAQDLGAGPWKTFFHILLPQLKPALLTGGLLVFTLSFDDFIIAFFTAGVGATTLPLKIYSMMKFGMTPEINALSSLILLISLLLVGLAFWSQAREKRQV